MANNPSKALGHPYLVHANLKNHKILVSNHHLDSSQIKKYQIDVLGLIQSKKIKQHLTKLVAIKPESPDKAFKGKLRKYQQDGLSWLIFLRNNRFGGVLADDMGLGKTLQTLTMLQKIKEEKGEAVAVRADVTNAESVCAMVAKETSQKGYAYPQSRIGSPCVRCACQGQKSWPLEPARNPIHRVPFETRPSRHIHRLPGSPNGQAHRGSSSPLWWRRIGRLWLHPTQMSEAACALRHAGRTYGR